MQMFFFYKLQFISRGSQQQRVCKYLPLEEKKSGLGSPSAGALNLKEMYFYGRN